MERAAKTRLVSLVHILCHQCTSCVRAAATPPYYHEKKVGDEQKCLVPMYVIVAGRLERGAGWKEPDLLPPSNKKILKKNI